MIRRAAVVVGVAGLAAAAGCDAILGIDDGTPREGGAAGDTGPDAVLDASDGGADAALDATDAGVPMCDPDASFDTPVAFTTLNASANDLHMRLVTGTELVAYFQSQRDGGLGGYDVYSATRPSIGDTWTSVTAATGVNTASADNDPSISNDQLTLYVSHASDLYRATRASTASAFGAPVALADINSALSDFSPYLIEDGSALYFSSTRASDAGVSRLYVTQPLADGGFTSPAGVSGTALTTGDNRFAAVTPDELVLYFSSDRTGGQGAHDIWVATRASTASPFGAPRIVPEVSSTGDDDADWVSADRCRLYFSSNKSGVFNVYVASKTPP